jgi:hypothetical protein
MKLAPITKFRIALSIFVFLLVASGVTAFPLLTELKILVGVLGLGQATSPLGYEGLAHWILTVYFGLVSTYEAYPWIAYGTDWLAFGHLVIALFFIHPILHPHQSRPNLNIGIVACLSVVPLALICGQIRGIPVYWRLIDCSFGVFGLVPLLYCRNLLRRIPCDGSVSG